MPPWNCPRCGTANAGQSAACVTCGTANPAASAWQGTPQPGPGQYAPPSPPQPMPYGVPAQPGAQPGGYGPPPAQPQGPPGGYGPAPGQPQYGPAPYPQGAPPQYGPQPGGQQYPQPAPAQYGQQPPQPGYAPPGQPWAQPVGPGAPPPAKGNRTMIAVLAAAIGLVAAGVIVAVVLANHSSSGSSTSVAVNTSTPRPTPTPTPRPSATPRPTPSPSPSFGSGSLVVPQVVKGEVRNTDPAFSTNLQGSANQLRAAGATGVVIAAYGPSNTGLPNHLLFAAAGPHSTDPSLTRQLVDQFDQGAKLTLDEASKTDIDEGGVIFTCWTTTGTFTGAACAWNETQTFGLVYSLNDQTLQANADWGGAGRLATLGQS